MKIATTTGDFLTFCNTDEERIRELHRAGFRYIDLDMYRFTPECEYMQENWKDAALRLKNLADELGMKFVQAHSQGTTLVKFPTQEEWYDFVIKATARSIEICEVLGIKNTVLHCIGSGDLTREEWLETNKKFYSRLFPTMERCGVNVLCENAPAKYKDNGRDMRALVDYVNHPYFHCCWDTGHANCMGNQYDEIMTVGKEIYAIHYNDNHGEKDEHIAPFMGNLNHDEVLTALIDVGYKGYFTLECPSSITKYNQYPVKRRRFEGNDKLREPQLFMQRHMEKLMYETAKWMLEQYGIFEE